MAELDQTFTGVIVGFAIAALLIVAALFQETLVAMARWLGHRGDRVVAAAATRAAFAARGAAAMARRFPSNLAGVARQLRQPSPATPTPSFADSAPGSEVGWEDRWPVRASGSAYSDRPGGALEEPPIEPASADPPELRPAPKDRRDEQFVDRRTYLPASSVAVAEKAREFLEMRGGSASAAALVQHLDGQFGRGRGIVLLEALRGRGAVELRRDPKATTRIEARLPGQGGGTGSGSRSP